ncbi:hypothetical protein ACIOGZ_35445 [Kitasatospora sp. NPDC088160]
MDDQFATGEQLPDHLLVQGVRLQLRWRNGLDNPGRDGPSLIWS